MNRKLQHDENLKGQTDSSLTNPQRRVRRTDASLNTASATASFEEQRACARVIGETQQRLTILRKRWFRILSSAVEDECQKSLNRMFRQADDLLREAREVLVQRNIVRTNQSLRSTGEVLDAIEKHLEQRGVSQQEANRENKMMEVPLAG